MRAGLDAPACIIRSATATNAELLLQKGKLGTIAPGAYADLLVVEGDPLADLHVLADPEKNLKLIMKDGVIYKNQLGCGGLRPYTRLQNGTRTRGVLRT